MSVRTLAILALPWLLISARTLADDLSYRYEANVVPYDDSAGWIGFPCETDCTDSVEDGHFVVRWWEWGELMSHHLWIAQPPVEPPPTLWVEWRFRSNNPIPATSFTCDANFKVKYGGMFDLVWMFADAAVSFSGDDFVLGLEQDAFHTFRFESLDGINYWISVDGRVFIVDAENQPNGVHYLQLAGRGGCDLSLVPRVNEWDFVRYGTIFYGEQIVASEPPSGFLDARNYAPLDRFTVTFDSPNYAYIDEITITAPGGDVPVVTQTRRRENDGPETVEIVLDRPIPMGETTRFIFDDGVAINEVEYTFAPGDTDGDGDADLHDFAAFQRCFGFTDLTGACLALDFNSDDTIDLNDYSAFEATLADP